MVEGGKVVERLMIILCVCVLVGTFFFFVVDSFSNIYILALATGKALKMMKQ